eukprot:6482426-Prymnesium_polylepis.1
MAAHDPPSVYPLSLLDRTPPQAAVRMSSREFTHAYPVRRRNSCPGGAPPRDQFRDLHTSSRI